MAQILPRDLPAVPGGTLNPNSAIVADDGTGVYRPTPAQITDAGAPINSKGDAEAGIVNTGRMTPLRVKQAIDALGVSQDVLASSTGGEMVGTANGNVQTELDVRAIVVGSIDEMIALAPQAGLSYLVSGYHPGGVDGGGEFRWIAGRAKADHDGVIVIDPALPWPADWTDDSDVAGWFTAAGGGNGCFVRQNVTLLTPEMAGALPSPTVSTRQFAALAVAMATCRKVQFASGATYRAAVFHPPARSHIEGNDALFERSVPTANPLIWLEEWTTVENLNVDGRLGDVASTSNRELGIAMHDYCIVRRCTATRTRRHGIGNRSVAEQLQYTGLLIEDCLGFDCGADPDPVNGTGTADGIGLVNCLNSKVVRSGGTGNARSGVTATSYNTVTTATDATLCVDVTFEECYAFDNSYGAALNMEVITRPRFINCRTDHILTFRSSPYAYVEGGEVAGLSGADAADYPVVKNVSVNNAATSSSLLVLQGKSPLVSGVTVKSTVAVPTNNLFYVMPSDSKGVVRDCTAIGGNVNFRLNVDNFSGLRSISASNVFLRDGPDGSSRTFGETHIPQKINGLIRGTATVAPTAGVWARGDRLENTLPSAAGTAGWVCTTGGTAGADAVFKTYGSIAA